MFGDVNSVTTVFIASTATGDNLEATPLERSYKCHVLGHYPESLPWNPFDKNAVGMVGLVFILRGSAAVSLYVLISCVTQIMCQYVTCDVS